MIDASEGDNRWARVSGRAALVTGGARRIGRGVALHLAAQGWDIGLQYNESQAEAKAVQSAVVKHGVNGAVYQTDFSHPEAAECLVEQFISDFPNAQLLVNGASIFEHDTIANVSLDSWRRHQDINALAPIMLAKFFHEKALRATCIINLLDQIVFDFSPQFFSYTMSKMALYNATQLLAVALAPQSRVNAIAPGLVLRSGDQTQAEFKRMHASTPLGVGPNVEEICQAISFVASAESMTGQVITMDGGRFLAKNNPNALQGEA